MDEIGSSYSEYSPLSGVPLRFSRINPQPNQRYIVDGWIAVFEDSERQATEEETLP